jgi:hypothetical protein
MMSAMTVRTNRNSARLSRKPCISREGSLISHLRWCKD